MFTLVVICEDQSSKLRIVQFYVQNGLTTIKLCRGERIAQEIRLYENYNRFFYWGWVPEDPLISPKDAPESSWLENEREAEELKDVSDDLIDVLDIEDEEDGENDKGS